MTDSPGAAPRPDPSTLKVQFLGLSFDPHRLIYSTIILMTAYAIYDEGGAEFETPRFLLLAGLTLAPLFALTMAHAFSDALDLQIRQGRRLNGHDRRHLLAENLEYLYIGIPPIVLAFILRFFSVAANTIVLTLLILGALSLAMWGVYAARLARLPGWTQFRFGVSYAVMGMVVIIIELLITGH